jgi:formyl-CoA transferase
MSIAGPLGGVTVLDLSGYIAAPYGCSLLADLGADVIKIEPPSGDNLRRYPSTLAKESRAFLGVNRGKLGIVIDLKQPDGLAVLHKMVQTADVLVHNFRPDVQPRLSIDYDTLTSRNPKLVYGALTGYGDDGPLKDRAGYDQVLQTMSGIAAEQGRIHSGEGAAPEIVYGSAVDFYAASLLAFAISAALFAREKTGQGRYVGVSLLGAALAMQSARLVRGPDEPANIDRDMRSGGITGLHPTKDGYLYLSANTPHFWRDLCEGLGLSELMQNPRYDSIAKRAAHADELLPKIREALRARSAFEWESLLADKVPCAVARPLSDMFENEQVCAMGYVADFPHPAIGSYRGAARPVSFDRVLANAPSAAPGLGQHSLQVLARYGYDGAEIERLLASGAVQ